MDQYRQSAEAQASYAPGGTSAGPRGSAGHQGHSRQHGSRSGGDGDAEDEGQYDEEEQYSDREQYRQDHHFSADEAYYGQGQGQEGSYQEADGRQDYDQAQQQHNGRLKQQCKQQYNEGQYNDQQRWRSTSPGGRSVLSFADMELIKQPYVPVLSAEVQHDIV
jgi:hypothetical protein